MFVVMFGGVGRNCGKRRRRFQQQTQGERGAERKKKTGQEDD